MDKAETPSNITLQLAYLEWSFFFFISLSSLVKSKSVYGSSNWPVNASEPGIVRRKLVPVTANQE